MFSMQDAEHINTIARVAVSAALAATAIAYWGPSILKLAAMAGL